MVWEAFGRCAGAGAVVLGVLTVAIGPAGASEGDDSAMANPAATRELPQVLVIGNAPLPGFGLPLDQIPSNVQTATSQDLESSQVNDVANYLSQRFMGV